MQQNVENGIHMLKQKIKQFLKNVKKTIQHIRRSENYILSTSLTQQQKETKQKKMIQLSVVALVWLFSV